MQRAIIYDDGLGELGVLTDLRAAFDIRTGALTNLERLTRLGGLTAVSLMCPAELVEVCREAHDGMLVDDPRLLTGYEQGDLLVNGRCCYALEDFTQLEQGQCLVERSSGQVIAYRPTGFEDAKEFVAGFAARGSADYVERGVLLHRPWHVRTYLEDALTTDLVAMSAGTEEPELRGVLAYGQAPLHVHQHAKVYPGAIFDCEHGPVVVDEHATVRPGAIVIGPSYIGPHATVLDRALVKASSAIGPWCKVAGEVGGVIFQGFCNKAHDGHLGDAYVGSWVNLGAGTTNSNLLNTYGEVTMRVSPKHSMEKTGRQFLGCIIGDHVKTAICTRIMTGCTLGTGAMYAATAAASGFVPRFGWITDDAPAGTKSFRYEKFEEVARAAMARRKLAPGLPMQERLKYLHGVATGVFEK